MIRFKLKELIAQKEYEEKRRITLEEVSTKTGIHRSTLSKINNQKGATSKIDIIDKLCRYFNVNVSQVIEYDSEE